MGGAGQNFGDQKQPQKLDKVQYLESLNHSQIDPRDPSLTATAYGWKRGHPSDVSFGKTVQIAWP